MAQKEDKQESWYTAFYLYAEYLRVLTDGALSHKALYSLVGSRGFYVNHQSSTVRKSAAGSLSRLLHSTQYVADLQESYEWDPSVFDAAAKSLAATLLQQVSETPAALTGRLLHEAWPNLRRGLAAELHDGRNEINLSRLDREIELMRAWAPQESVRGNALGALTTVLSNFFYLVAFGHIEEGFANSMVDDSPTSLLEDAGGASAIAGASLRACIVRVADGNASSIENMWTVDPGTTFCIGRYMDCDAIETDAQVSRRHCSIFQQGGCWCVRDEGSRFGTQVIRGGLPVWTSWETGAAESFPLMFGDYILLAAHVHYQFVSLQNSERLLLG